MTLTFAFILIGAALASLYAWGLNTQSSVLRTAVRAGSILCLAIAAVAGEAPGLCVAALAIFALADACFAQGGQRWLLLGMATAIFGHCVFILMFLNQGALFFSGSIEVTAQMIIYLAGFVLLMSVWRTLGEMAGPVVVQAVAVSSMTALAVALPGFKMVGVGAMMVYASDGVLAREIFLPPETRMQRVWARPAVWALYWCGMAFVTAGYLAPVL